MRMTRSKAADVSEGNFHCVSWTKYFSKYKVIHWFWLNASNIVYHNELTINFLKPPVAALNKITEFTIIIIILGKSHIDSLIFLELFILFSKEGFIYLYSTEYCLLSSAH